MNNDFGSTPFVGASPDFLHFVNLCEQVRITKSKNMKVGLLSRYLSSMDDESLTVAVLFLSSRIFPLGSKFVINVVTIKQFYALAADFCTRGHAIGNY